MSPPQVPHLPAEWPPTPSQLAVMVSDMQWVLSDLAYELPRHGVSRVGLDNVADALEGLAGLLRHHKVQ